MRAHSGMNRGLVGGGGLMPGNGRVHRLVRCRGWLHGLAVDGGAQLGGGRQWLGCCMRGRMCRAVRDGMGSGLGGMHGLCRRWLGSGGLGRYRLGRHRLGGRRLGLDRSGCFQLGFFLRLGGRGLGFYRGLVARGSLVLGNRGLGGHHSTLACLTVTKSHVREHTSGQLVRRSGA